ncbi:MAG: O-antigen ligase family protein [Candidatus Methylomirabilaceae bacterium]
MRQRLNRFGRTSAPQASGGQPGLQALPPQRAGPLLRWALYGFLFTLPFDAPGTLPLELTTITGAVFLVATLLQPRLCYARRPAAFWWFMAYQYVFWIAYVVGGAEYTADAVRSSLFYIQGLLIFCACFNLMQDERITRKVLLTLLLATALLAVMIVLGIGKVMETESGRATVLGQNPNRAARALCVGVLIAVGLVFGRPKAALRPRWVAWPIAAFIGLAMIMGGSRGGLLALAFGLWAFSLAGNTLGTRIRNIVVALLAIGLATWGALRSPLMRERLQQAAAGNLAKREQIFPVAFQMVKDQPLIGYGPANHYVLAVRLGLPPRLHLSRDTHNLFLEVLTATGVLGATPFMIGLWLCCWSAWKARRGMEGILPVAQLAAILVGNMSGNYITLKLQWVLFAYALASWTYFTAKPARPSQPSVAQVRRARWG